MIILGIDPGLAIVGWGVIEAHRGQFRPIACGDVNTPAHTSVESRLESIYRDLNRIIEKYKPDEVAIEELFFTNNITTGITVAEARGVILLACRMHGIPIHEYTPPQVKQAVVGYGKAEKRQVIAMVTSLLKLSSPPKPDDTADALAIALCHGQVAGSALKDFFNQP
ncbi:MAG: crossover junction endodeoxyribonuclease RuvC [Clostridia bacterium]|nr:crossover junction endodeoxyribonuclease RuvC [Clostridia bacterium]